MHGYNIVFANLFILSTFILMNYVYYLFKGYKFINSHGRSIRFETHLRGSEGLLILSQLYSLSYVEKEQKTSFDKSGTRFYYYGQI